MNKNKNLNPDGFHIPEDFFPQIDMPDFEFPQFEIIHFEAIDDENDFQVV